MHFEVIFDKPIISRTADDPMAPCASARHEAGSKAHWRLAPPFHRAQTSPIGLHVLIFFPDAISVRPTRTQVRSLQVLDLIDCYDPIEDTFHLTEDHGPFDVQTTPYGARH